MSTSGPPEAVYDSTDPVVPFVTPVADACVADPGAVPGPPQPDLTGAAPARGGGEDEPADQVPVPRGVVSSSGVVPSGVVSSGAVSSGVVSSGVVSSGAVSNGAVSNGAVSNGATPSNGTPAGGVPLGAVPGAAIAEPPGRRWGLGAYLLAEALFLLSSVALALPFIGSGDEKPPPVLILLGLLVPTVLAAGVAVMATVLRGNGPGIDLGLRFDRTDLTRGLAFGVCGLALSIPAGALWSKVVGPEANSAVGELFAGQRFALPLAVAAFLVMWLVAPICEEIVYRGLLWGAVERLGAVRWWAFGITTLCFALVHFELTRTPLLLVISVPIGLARLYTGRLGASIVAHQVNNFLPAMWLMLMLLGITPA